MISNFQATLEVTLICLGVMFFALFIGGCGLLGSGNDTVLIDRLKETNQDIYGCINIDVAARGGRVNLILVPKGQPLPADTKMPQC